MRKARILLILGTWVTILTYLGFPNSWKDILFTLSGFGLIFLSYMFYLDYRTENNRENAFDNFRENRDFKKRNEIENTIEESE